MMTDNEIVLEYGYCSVISNCNECQRYEQCLSDFANGKCPPKKIRREILDLINRQNAELDIELNIMNRQNNEIWQLKEEIKRMQNERKPNEGQWIEHYSFDVWHYDCPFCDDGYATKGRDTTPPNFCSNCGAKLSGVKCEENNYD